MSFKSLKQRLLPPEHRQLMRVNLFQGLKTVVWVYMSVKEAKEGVDYGAASSG